MRFFKKIISVMKKPLQIKQDYQALRDTVHVLRDTVHVLLDTVHELERANVARDDVIRRIDADLHDGVQSVSQAGKNIVQSTSVRIQALERMHSYQPQESVCNTGLKEDISYLSAECGKGESLEVLYSNIAQVFRGDGAWLKTELERLVPYIEFAECKELPFVDCGCGQGAFLDVLEEHGIKAVGVDFNPVSVKPAMEHGHEVVIDDAIEYLRRQKDDSVRGISMIMVVEHIPFEQLFHDFFLFARKTASGGVCVINTINTYCYRRMGAFCLDPSHVNFAPPDLYKIVMEMAGYINVKMIWSVPLSGHAQSDEWYTQYENVSLIGYKP